MNPIISRRMLIQAVRPKLRRPPRTVSPPGPFGVRALATASGAFLDVTKEIRIDHNNVRELFERYQQVSTLGDKKVIANTLIREMAIHGDAEEVSVYNDYERLGLKETAIHNKEEHAEVKKLVFKAEHMPTNHEEYDNVLSQAVRAFIAHAEEEENEQHPTIRERLTPEQNDEIAREFLKARTSVPIRPHPLAPQSGGLLQKGMGMHGKVQDKIVEKVTGREYVDLKFGHPEV